MKQHQKILITVAALAAACSSADDRRNAPGAKPPRPPSASGAHATSLGMVALSVDERSRPRLLRAVARRPARAGLAPDVAASEHLAALEPLWLDGQTAADRAVTATQELRGGARMVLFAQTIAGIPIHDGQVKLLLRADGSLSAVSGVLQAAPPGPSAFRLTPEAATAQVLGTLLQTQIAPQALTRGAVRGGFQSLTVPQRPDVAVRSARAQQEYFSDGDRLVPAWSVEVLGAPRSWDTSKPLAKRVHIADADGRVLRTAELAFADAFVYRTYADRRGGKRPFDGPVMSFMPHLTGVPDGWFPDPIASNLVAMASFNAPRDPWLPDDARATTGNNVAAYADLDGSGTLSEGDGIAEVQFGRLLNYRYDLDREPLDGPEQMKASITNLFYVTNWLHDWYYDSGFTEAVGNAQMSNLGRGGIEGDPLLAHAQADIFGARDNAFAEVPSDGESPSVNMFLWSAATEGSLTLGSGESFEVGFLVSGASNFDVSGQVVSAYAAGPSGPCQPVTRDVAGKIAVVNLEDFGAGCAPAQAVLDAQAKGALGVIGRIPFPDDRPTRVPGLAGITVPFVAVTQTAADAIRARLDACHAAPVTARLRRVTHGVELDGSLDTGVVAHEWGHYLHLRLTTCETAQCGAMSEGWADFVALHLQLRPEDDRTGACATGAYALQNLDPNAAFFGGRRVTYSTDRTKNDLSFRHIANGEPLPTTTPLSDNGVENAESHNSGEVWTTMLWDAYNALLDNRGFTRGQRLMSDYMVAGMMLQPPDPTFTESRDALLTATAAMDEDDMLAMAAAFAGRGAGTCAISPPRESFTNIGVVESRTVSGRFEIGGPELGDDGASCDHDGRLDPGESGTLHLTIANGGVDALTGIVVTPRTTSTGVTLSDPVEIGDLDPFESVEIAIPVQIATDAPADSNLDIDLDVQGDGGCTAGGVTVGLRQRLGVDEVTNESTIDDCEALNSAWTRTGDSADVVWSLRSVADHDHAWHAASSFAASDTRLVSPVLRAGTTEPLVVTWDQRYRLEVIDGENQEGAVVEVSTDHGATWTDVSTLGVDPHYTGTVACCDNALAGRRAYTGSSAGYPAFGRIVLDFGRQFAGKDVQLGFRNGGLFNASGGWDLDDIRVTGITNTPFTAVRAEPEVCTGAPALRSGLVRRLERSPRASLQDVPLPAEVND